MPFGSLPTNSCSHQLSDFCAKRLEYFKLHCPQLFSFQSYLLIVYWCYTLGISPEGILNSIWSCGLWVIWFYKFSLLLQGLFLELDLTVTHLICNFTLLFSTCCLRFRSNWFGRFYDEVRASWCIGLINMSDRADQYQETWLTTVQFKTSVLQSE